jgi:hypothetical protein
LFLTVFTCEVPSNVRLSFLHRARPVERPEIIKHSRSSGRTSAFIVGHAHPAHSPPPPPPLFPWGSPGGATLCELFMKPLLVRVALYKHRVSRTNIPFTEVHKATEERRSGLEANGLILFPFSTPRHQRVVPLALPTCTPKAEEYLAVNCSAKGSNQLLYPS